jgi:hypothetical protein
MPHFHVYFEGTPISCADTEADVRIALAEFILRLRNFGTQVTALPDGNSFLVRESGSESTKFLSWLEGSGDDCPDRSA